MHTEGDTLVVSGDIDLYQAPAFRSAAEAHIAAIAQPRFDLSGVPFLDSAGLATLLYLSRQAGEQEKTLRMVVTGGPRRVLKITGIDRVLMLED
jgi:anti-sigma B factor antagonist